MVSTSILYAATLLAGLVSASEHHLHKRDIVTEYAYVTKTVHANVEVIVDPQGNPLRTETVGFETEGSGSAPSVQTTTVVPSAAYSPPAAAPEPSSAVSSAQYEPIAPSSQAVNRPSVSASKPIPPVVQPSKSSTKPSPSVPAVPTTSSVPAVETSSPASSAPAPSSGSGEQFQGEGTFYNAGLGACGWTNTDTDLIVALNAPQWDGFGKMSNGNPACGKTVTITRGSKSVTAKVVDKCPGCKRGDLDLSPAAFDKLGDQDEGRIPITWSFN